MRLLWYWPGTVNLRVSQPLGKPEQAESISQQIAAAFPQRRLPRFLTLGLSRALPN